MIGHGYELGDNLMINDLDIVQWDYLLSPEFEMINSAGKPLTGGYIEVYIHGTRNKYYCASDFNGTLHPFQIPLDSIGSNVILASPENAYDVYVYNKFGSLIMSRYNVHCQGGNGGSSTYVGDKLYYGQYRASNVTTIANLNRNKGNINLTSNGYLKLKNGMSYHITVRGAFQVDDVTNTDTTLNYIEYTSVNPIKIDIDETKEGPQYFELSYDIYRLPEDMDYQVTFAQSNGMVTELLVEVHSLSNLATSAAGGDQEYEPGWGIDITNNVISVDPSILEDLEYTAGDYISIVDNTISVTGIDPNSYATHDEVHEATVTAIEYVTGIIPEAQVQSDWDETDDTQPSYIQNKPDLDIYATHDEVNNVSGQIIETVNNVSGVLHEEITNNNETVIETINNVSGILHEEIIETAQVITGLIPDVSDFTTHEEVYESSVTAIQLVTGLIPTDYTTHEEVNEAIVTAIDLVTGMIPDAQVQSDWEQSDDTQPDYIKNKPDLDIYATHDEVNTVSGQIIETVNNVSGDIIETVNNVSAILQGEIENIPEQQQSDWNQTDDTQVDYIKNKPDLDIYVTHDELIEAVSAVTGIGDYGQFYATAVSGAATMARTKGTIEVTNDGKIKLKKGGSYHVTVRGRYNQTTPNNVYGVISYIEYITNNNININVDKSITESQYFEISYDLYKLNSDSNYYVFFSGLEGTVNDLFIEIHAIGSVGAGVSGGAGTEYDAGWGIQILNNVISVDPTIFNDYVTENELATAIQSVVTAIPAAQVQSDWNQTNSAQPDYIKNKPNLNQYATDTEVSNAIVTAIEAVTAMIPAAQVQSDWTEDDNTDPAYIKNKPDEYNLVAGQNIGIFVAGDNVTIAASATDLSNYATDTEAYNATVTAINLVTGMIPNYTAGDNIDITNDVIALKDVVRIDSRNEAPEGYIAVGNIVHWGHDDYGPGIMVSAVMDDYADNRHYLWLNTSDQGREERYWGQYGNNRDAQSVSGESFLYIQEGDVRYQRGDFDRTDRVPVIWSCSGMRYDIDRLQEAVTAIPEAQVQSDWNETNSSSKAYIKNKPNLNQYVTDIEAYNAVVTGVQAATGWVNSQGYLTSVPSTYATDIEVSQAIATATNDMATKTWVGNQGYLTSVPSNYATDSEVSQAIASSITDFVTEEQVTALIPESEEVQFEELNITQFAMASTIPTIELNNSDQVTAIDGHTLAGGGVDSDIFWAIYNTTTYEDVLAAYNVGKKILAYDSGTVWTLVDKSGNPDTFKFTRIIEPWSSTGPKLQYMQLSSRDGWYKSSGYPLQADWNETYNYYPSYIKNKPSIPTIQLNSNDQVTAIDNHEIAGTGDGGGGTTYTAGEYISIDSNDVISVTGLAPVSGSDGIAVNDNVVSLDSPIEIVAGNNIEITVTGVSAIISAQGGGGGTTYTGGQYINIDSNDVISVTGLQVAGSYATTSDISDMATKTWVGNQGYLTAVPNTYATKVYVDGAVSGKQDKLTAGSNISISGNTIAVTGMPASPVQSDWSVTNTSSLAYIKNKPTIPAAPVQSNWNETNTSSLAYIKNKPDLSVYATTSAMNTAVNNVKPMFDRVTRTGNTDISLLTTTGVGSGKLTVNLGSIFNTSYSMNEWTYCENNMWWGNDNSVRWFTFSARLNNIVATQWSQVNNAIQLKTTDAVFISGIRAICGDSWNPTTIVITNDSSWTSTANVIRRDIRNSSTADNNTYYIWFSGYIYVPV